MCAKGPKRCVNNTQYFRAIQNAERLHGSGCIYIMYKCTASTPCTVRLSRRIPYIDMKNNKNNNTGVINFNATKAFKPGMLSIPAPIRSSLTPDGAEWLVAALDPFHDFEHPIRGAPDHVSSKSYVRVYNQSVTLSATADDDFISVLFTGFHSYFGRNFYAWGTDGECNDMPAAGVAIYPIQILRSTLAQGQPSLTKYVGGTSTTIGQLGTCQVGDVPSRLVALGVEVIDITPSLYKKGTIMVAHSNGEAEIGCNCVKDRTAVTARDVQYSTLSKPALVWSNEVASQLPGTYIGAIRDGVYTQARLNEVQPPGRQTIVFDAATGGAHGRHPVIREHGTTARETFLLAPTSDFAGDIEMEPFFNSMTWLDSGFQPLSIMCSGLSVETVLQVVVKATVEYFPEPTHPFECGLANFSPQYDPRAFILYHEAVRYLPYAVPVGQNAHGDFWRKVQSALQNAGRVVVAGAPYLLEGASAAALAAGQPEVAAIAQAVKSMLTVRKQQPRMRRRG